MLLVQIAKLSVNGQPVKLYRDTSVQIIHGSQNLKNAWSGGMNTPVFGEIDINGDGKMDLVEYDAPSFRVNPYINLGIANQASYVYAPEFASRFPIDKMEGWIRTFDYDFDGDMDLFTYYIGGLALFRNDYSPGTGLVFTMITGSMETFYGSFSTNIWVSRVNAPALADLDNDGDMDILSFSISGSWVEYQKNFAKDSTGNPAVITKFHNKPVCWGYFALSSSTNVANLPPYLPTCPLLPAQLRQAEVDKVREEYKLGTGPLSLADGRLRHAGSSLLAADLNGDGDKDLLNGDILGNTLLYLENCGTPDSAWICAQDSLFPSYDIPAQMKDVAGPHYMDVDNDGNRDLIVSNFFFTGEDYYNVKFYRNSTNNMTNQFSYVTNRFLVDQMLDVGTGAHPVFVDIDQDGKTDLLVANDFYFNNGNPIGQIAYYKNTSVGASKSYALVSNDWSGFSTSGLLGLYPAFGDLDGDNDLDLLVGESSGTLVYYQNIAGAGNPMNFVFGGAIYQSIDIGDNATPQLVDVDRDGKLDLIIGERSGVLNYYRNTGTTSVPVFSFVTNNFGGVNVLKVNSIAGFSSPLLFDYAGSYELLVGSLSGYLYHYSNIDGNLGGTFALLDSMFQNIHEPQVAVPAMNDVDGDGRFDLVIGSLSGGLVLYTQNPTLSLATVQVTSPYFELYPNPAGTFIVVSAIQQGPSSATAQVYDVRGRLVNTFRITNNNFYLDLSGYDAGMYLLTISSGEERFSRRFIKE